MTADNPESDTLLDAQYALSIAKVVPDARTLDQAIQDYPAHAIALTTFAVELVLDAIATSDVETPIGERHNASPAVMRAMSRFQNHLHEDKRDSEEVVVSKQAVPNPFASLSRTELRMTTKRLGATSLFVMKLRDRQVAHESMNAGFKKLVADVLDAPIEVVDAHFAAPQVMQPGMHFKADAKPNARLKETFGEALNSSGLTSEQQEHLRNL